MSDTLELVELDQETIDDLTPVCKFGDLRPGTFLFTDPCGKLATHIVTLHCGDIYFACDEHAEKCRDPKIVMLCGHGDCKVRSVVLL